MKKWQRGQGLFEMLIVLAIAVLVIAGVASVVTTSIKNSSFAQNQADASRLGQEAVEWVRQERNNGWSVFSARADSPARNYCVQSLSWNIQTACLSTQTIGGVFLRDVSLELLSSDRVEVDVNVHWSDGRGAHESRLSTVLTNWQ